MNIQFYAYGLDLDINDGSALIAHAVEIAADHQPIWHQPMQDDLLMDDDSGIHLIFNPQNGVTWGAWYKVALAIQIFFSRYLKVEFNFNVMMAGRQAGSLGHGLMRENAS